MSTPRREFLGTASRLAAGALVLPPSMLDAWLTSEGEVTLRDPRPPEIVARDEAFWARVRRAYDLQHDVLNLDHGWTNPTPRAAVDELARGARALEALPAEQLVKIWETVSSTTVRRALADAMSVPPTEIALVRNATEALDNVLLGVPLRAGDEVVCSIHDYYAMLDALEQRRARDGVVLRIVQPPVPARSMDALEAVYAAAIGPRTRLVLLTHPSNLTGQFLPARRIADRAHAAGAEVVVDGAQSLGLLQDPVRSLGCDYYGASCHKWLGTPVGLGVLWMRPEHTSKVWPLIPPAPDTTGMARFEWIGTAPEYINPAALPALALHTSLGAERKAARLRCLAAHLRSRITSAVPDGLFYTENASEMSCGLTTVEFPRVDSAVLQKRLRERHGILVQAMTGIRSAPEMRGIRVSPNVYTTPSELDRVVGALAKEVATLRQ